MYRIFGLCAVGIFKAQCIEHPNARFARKLDIHAACGQRCGIACHKFDKVAFAAFKGQGRGYRIRSFKDIQIEERVILAAVLCCICIYHIQVIFHGSFVACKKNFRIGSLFVDIHFKAFCIAAAFYVDTIARAAVVVDKEIRVILGIETRSVRVETAFHIKFRIRERSGIFEACG